MGGGRIWGDSQHKTYKLKHTKNKKKKKRTRQRESGQITWKRTKQKKNHNTQKMGTSSSLRPHSWSLHQKTISIKRRKPCGQRTQGWPFWVERDENGVILSLIPFHSKRLGESLIRNNVRGVQKRGEVKQPSRGGGGGPMAIKIAAMQPFWAQGGMGRGGSKGHVGNRGCSVRRRCPEAGVSLGKKASERDQKVRQTKGGGGGRKAKRWHSSKV